MWKKVTAAAAILTVGIIAGCGGGGGTAPTATVSGVVADGYLRGAEVFLDRNGTYQWDGTEPRTTTGPGGTYSLTVPAGDVGRYPVVVRAMAGSTVDEDTGQAVQNDYVMSAPAGAGSFVSPLSTMVREKMEATPGMTMTQAMTQLRNQLNMPAGMDLLGDYVAGSNQTGPYQTQYRNMHQTAQQMAALMAGQAGLVMSGSSVNKGRYRLMMGQINQNLPQIANNAYQGMGMGSAFMTTMQSQLQTMLAAMTSTGGFGNYSGMFRNMTTLHYFWNYSGSRMQPTGGTMGVSGMMGTR
ncbi:hypothetical protein [Geobacter sp.]|uniref:hypothetical protein n=1 Tax=Geobacter sp. TaxID=46610 RepID=UPI00262F3DDA|nr:hypothetical protein [Geobacter sp.]